MGAARKIETDELRNEIASFQADFCDTSEPEAKAIIGAKGSGKTWIDARFIAKMIDEMPGSKGIFASPTNRQTEDIWEQDIKTLLDSLNWKYEWNQTKGIVRFWNGAILHLRSAESPERIESIQYHWGCQDEVSLSSLDFCKTIKSRVRAMSGNGHMRFTSMPADPDDFIYDYVERVCGAHFHEVTLFDNPDKEFVRAYEKQLREIYSGSELDRLLYAKRVSLTGLGLFAANNEHRVNAEYDPLKELYLDWDFNVEYRAVTAWQEVGKENHIPVMNCIQSFQLKNYTTVEDARELCRYFSDQRARIFLHGDASGENRSAQTSDSMWNQIRKVFNEQFSDVRFVVPRSNPNVKDTIQVTNWALRKNLIQFSDKAKIAYRYLVAAKADKYGEIDKANDYKEGGAKSHEVDTIRYLVHYIYERYFPGAEKKTVTKRKLQGF